MAFGSNEVREGAGKTYYTGVENFSVVAVNPTKEELEALYGREIQYDPTYLSEQSVSDADGERDAANVKIDFYLKSSGDENITTKMTFYVTNTHHKGQSGKIRVINDFGGTTWLTQDDIDDETLPGNMQWYNSAGLKIAKRGEEELIDFIKNLLNTPMKPDGLAKPEEAHAFISKENWDAIFGGDFSLFKGLVSSTKNKVGVLLGVKVKPEGGMVQTTYTKKVLRQYTLHSKKDNKFDWLDKSVQEAKANGAFGNVDFGDNSYVLKEFTITPTQLSLDDMPAEDDVFAMDATADAEDDFMGM